MFSKRASAGNKKWQLPQEVAMIVLFILTTLEGAN
jgi:hypothetical protein